VNKEPIIAAIVTPRGSGGISVIRVSGEKSIEIVSKFFKGKIQLKDAHPWRVYFGKFITFEKSKETTMDQVLLTVFKKPNSYTGEDVVEISCHGGPFVTISILNTIVNEGVELAKPGEFTLRAFLNGRIDLTQAEAVSDVIQAKSKLSLKSSIEQLEGTLSKSIEAKRSEIVNVISLLELELDFSEEDVEFIERKKLRDNLLETKKNIEQLIRSYQRGKNIKEGVRVVIIGKPNVGKSSLLNALVKADRAIVTDIPGTTRDVIEDIIEIQGQLFRVSDTAGIIESNNSIEQEGIQRTQKMIDRADIVLALFDASQEPDQWDKLMVQGLTKKASEKRIIGVLNKMDIHNLNVSFSWVKNYLNIKFIELSAKKLWGFDVLERELVDASNSEIAISSDELILTNIRHKLALEDTLKNLNHAIHSIEEKLSPELIVIDLRTALDSLGQIVGVTTPEDILNEIFSKFCIGK